MSVPVVAIVGRPNVGKSSLFNWLAGRRIAIVDPTAGVTRDRVSTLIKANDRFFELIDTGGMGAQDVDNLTVQVERQIEAAMEQAHVVLFVVDARNGLMPLDEEVARRLRYVDKPVICVANKCDSPELENQTGEFYKLGRGKLVHVSAHQNRGRDELLELIHERLPQAEEADTNVAVSMKLAIVGRRNIRFERDGKVFIAIDTAGVRRKGSISSDIEFYSMARAERSVRRADVVLLFLDPRVRISKVDKQLADYVLEHHKPAVFVVNKWDLMVPMPTGKMGNYIRATFPNLDYVPIAFITAKDGKNVQGLLNLSQNLQKQASTRVGTGDLNRVLRLAVSQNPPPMRQNRRPKVFYGTQVGANPPTIVLFANDPELFDNTYQRYLLKTFRDNLPFNDVPIKLHLRRRSREDQEPVEPAAPPPKKKKPAVDLSGLKFQSTVSEDEIEREAGHYESELWKDL